jgi:ribonuclease P protein component
MQTFSKDERLCSKLLFARLIEKGNSFFVHPYKVVWLESDHEGSKPVQMAVSVPKKRFKKAVHRNRVKRLTREAYRRNKQELYDALARMDKKLLLLLVYSASELPAYSGVEGKIKVILQRLIKQYAESA